MVAETQSARVISRGYLSDFSVASVLQALSLSRQFTMVTFFREDGGYAGRVFLKAGMLLDVEAPDRGERDLGTFEHLLHQKLHTFQVERLPPADNYPVPLARITTTLSLTGQQVPKAPANDPEPTAKPAAATTTAAPVTKAPRGRPIIAVTSPKGGCGKTSIAINLAVALANTGMRVLLVDADPNGDVMSSMNARARPKTGVYDALLDGAKVTPMPTSMKTLSIIPATGPTFPTLLGSKVPSTSEWSTFFAEVQSDADVIVVDTAAGVMGPTAPLLSACTHVIGVMQAEALSQRSFEMFQHGLTRLTPVPEVLGVVINMFRRSHESSVSAMVEANKNLPDPWLFETSIPRADAFLEAAEIGRPLSFLKNHSAVTWLFDALAQEARTRLRLSATRAQEAGPFLL